MIKAIGTAYMRPGLTREEFFRYWREHHAPLSARAPGLRGYVVSEVLQRVQGTLEADAFVEQWYDDEETYLRALESPELAEAVDDVGNYARLDGTFWVTREHVFIPPPVVRRGLLEDGSAKTR